MTKRYRDAGTGKWTTAADATNRPAETVSETVPTRHETPDVAELRRLAEACPMPENDPDTLNEWYELEDLTERNYPIPPVDAEFIAAANPATMLGLLDRLAHMTEARDNARHEVGRLSALVAETEEPHPDRPDCTRVGGKGVRVTATDLETGESESVVIDNNYVLICAGDRYQSEVQRHANGTAVLTVKVRKHLAALDGAES